MRKLFYLITLLLWSAIPSTAQSCDVDIMSGDLIKFAVNINDLEDPSPLLDEIAAWVATQQTACGENAAPEATVSIEDKQPVLTYSNTINGMQPVIGPIDLTDGVYRVRAVTSGFMIVTPEVTKGTCQLTSVFGMFNLSQGQGEQGAEVLLIAEGCQLILSVSNTTQDWTLEFFQVTESDIKDVQTTYSNEIYGNMPVLGPIRFPNGRYRVTVTTLGFFIANVETVTGTCQTDSFLGLFNLSSGDAIQGAQTLLTTTDCVAFVTISNVTEDWSLKFEALP